MVVLQPADVCGILPALHLGLVYLLWTSALPTLALFCAALQFQDYKDDSESGALERLHLDDRSQALQGTAGDHRSVPGTRGNLLDSQTADTSHRLRRTRIDSNNRPWARRSNWRTRNGRFKVGNWRAAGVDNGENVAYLTYDYEDYQPGLGVVLDKSDYDYVNWNFNQDYDVQLDDFPATLFRGQRKKINSFRDIPDSIIQPQKNWNSLRPGRPRPWETVANNFAPSDEEILNIHRSVSPSLALPQSEFITPVPTVPTRMSSIPTMRDASLSMKLPMYTPSEETLASPFHLPVNFNSNSRSTGRKKKKRSSNPLIRMREFLLGGGDDENVEEKKNIEIEPLRPMFYRSVALERTLKNENPRPESGGKANILLVLNKDEKDFPKSVVSESPHMFPDMGQKSSIKPIDFDKTEQGEPLIVIDVEKVTKLVQDDPSIRPDGNKSKKSTMDKKPTPEFTRKPLENIDYSVPVLPSRLPHIADYYGALGNHEMLILSSPLGDILGNHPNLPEDVKSSFADPLLFSDEFLDYNLNNDYSNGALFHQQNSPSTSVGPQTPIRKDLLFSQYPPFSSDLQHVHATRPKNIKMIKSGVPHQNPYQPPRHYGYPHKNPPHIPFPIIKPHTGVHNKPIANPLHQQQHLHGNYGQKPILQPPNGHPKDPHNFGHPRKHYGRGSSLIILENVFPKGKNNFPQKTGIYEYGHESLGIPPYDPNPYVKEFSHFLPKDDDKDVLLEYTANKKEDIKGVALLIARGNEHQGAFVPYKPHTSHSGRRNFEEANGPEDDDVPIYFAQLEFKNRTSDGASDQLRLENNQELLVANLEQFEDQTSLGERIKEVRIIAPGSFSSLEEWTEDSQTVIKSGGGSIPEGSEEA